MKRKSQMRRMIPKMSPMRMKNRKRMSQSHFLFHLHLLLGEFQNLKRKNSKKSSQSLIGSSNQSSSQNWKTLFK